jgi:lipoprotein NlpD
MRIFAIVALTGMLYGCEVMTTPVTTSKSVKKVNPALEVKKETLPVFYKVKRGDTLYAISWRFKRDEEALIQLNHLKSPYRLCVGQILRLEPSAHQSEKHSTLPKQVKHDQDSHQVRSTTELKTKRQPNSKMTTIQWCQPLRGNVSLAPPPYHGLWVGHSIGGEVRAAAAGKVVYAGAAMPGYGRLILIQHGGHFISAYAFNQKILVNNGQQVDQSQVIAYSGQDLDRQQGLYFELRKQGVPYGYWRLRHMLHTCK